MPRDGSEVYYIPPGTEGIPDSTIESIKYNEFVHDVEQDLNHPRPIVAGGTGGSTEEEALFNLSGETAYQVVTNFDTHPYIPGSFYADAAATAPPVAGHAFAGIIYQANLAGDMVVEARDLTTGVNYIRIHSGGVWGTWDVDNTSQFVKKSGDTMTGPLILNADPSSGLGAATKQYADAKGAFTPSGNIAATTVQGAIAELDTEKVAKLGDTMTGDLTINKAIPTINLKKTAAGQNNTIAGYNNATARWVILLGDSAAEGGADAGSDFAVQAFDDSGAYKHQVLNINRAAGLIQVKGDPTAALGVATKQYVDGKAPVAATAAEYIANSAPTKMLTSGAVWAAVAIPATLTDAATVTPDFNLGIDFAWMLGAVGRTLANPINFKVGMKGMIYLTQDGTGNRTITSWGSMWKFPGGVKPTLSTGPFAGDAISYVVINSTAIYCTFNADFK